LSRIGLTSGDDFANNLIKLSAKCLSCGASIIFEEGGSLALDYKLKGKVVMCKHCRSVHKADILPYVGMQLTLLGYLKVRDFVGKTEEEALQLVYHFLLEEAIEGMKVSMPAKDYSVTAQAYSAESAIEAAKAKIPSSAFDLSSPQILEEVKRDVKYVLAWNEDAARQEISEKLVPFQKIKVVLF
jgi:hypothetical protein